MAPIIRVPALVPFLRCPDQRCGKRFTNAESAIRYRGALKCVRSACRQRWLAEPLAAGDVRYQLEQNLEDADIAADLMLRFRLPETIDEPMYFQIPLTGELWDGYVQDQGLGPSLRTRRLVGAILNKFHVLAHR